MSGDEGMTAGPAYEQIERLDDARLDVYRDLKRTNATRWTEVFIAEGRLVVERLLAAKDWEVESVLVSAERLERIRDRLRPGVPVYVVSHAACSQLVGFNFHAGLMACGRRRRRNRVELAGGWSERGNVTLVACPQVSMPDNLGSIIRLAAAFRMDGVIAGPMSADAFSRRVVRVSMGNILSVPVFEPEDFEAELGRLIAEEGFEAVGASRSARAEPLRQFVRASKTILVLGNEANGLRGDWESLCRREVTIEMSSEVDSLNVSTAAGILMYHLSGE
ncbi:MAG: TrmH family RNA methyltransferase [Planctomycetota bacterium]